jgi:hypothetical protein
MMIKNQIFKFCENAGPAGNPNPFGCGGKKSKVLLRGYARSNALAYGVTSAFKSGFLP